MKPSQEFSWSSEESCFYYINNEKNMYCRISKDEYSQVYKFLMHVYSVNWSIAKKYIKDYTYANSIEEISKY